MESLLGALEQKDIKTRLEVLPRLESAVEDGQLEPEDVARAVAILAGCTKDNNFRVCQGALSVLAILVRQLSDEFRAHIPTVMPGIINTLGDPKQPVRSAAVTVVTALMKVVGPSVTYEYLMPSLSKMNSRCKQQVAVLFTDNLATYELRALPVSKMTPAILGFLNDVKPDVREAAINCIVELYKHMGGQLRNDLGQRQIRPAHMKLLNDRFDQVGYVADDLLDAPPAPSAPPSGRSVADRPIRNGPPSPRAGRKSTGGIRRTAMGGGAGSSRAGSARSDVVGSGEIATAAASGRAPRFHSGAPACPSPCVFLMPSFSNLLTVAQT